MTSQQPVSDQDVSADGVDALTRGSSLLDGQFIIEKKLAQGGFGITYLANDTSLERAIVIKECYPEAFVRRDVSRVVARTSNYQDQYRSIVEMFMREARSVAMLRHPNIVGVHRVFEENDTAYMALDLIEGRDLSQIVEAGSDELTPELVKKTLLKLLDAVDVVHEHDLLHRDISPDNILLDKWGSPVLIDFGAAREEASKKTRAMSAMLVVKDGYSPQEFYLAGSKQNPSSDIYALAATFYHVISGEAPPNSQIRMAAIASNSPDPCEPLEGRIRGYDNEFLSIIDKAMNVLPKDRIQNAREWIDLIDPNKVHPTEFAHPPLDENLEKSLSRLVAETNEFVKKSEGVVQDKPRAAAPKPKKSSSTPDWVDEFNAETNAATGVINLERPGVSNAKAVHEGVSFDADASARMTSQRNWISRAQAKEVLAQNELAAFNNSRNKSKVHVPTKIALDEEISMEEVLQKAAVEEEAGWPKSKLIAAGVVVVLGVAALQLNASELGWIGSEEQVSSGGANVVPDAGNNYRSLTHR